MPKKTKAAPPPNAPIVEVYWEDVVQKGGWRDATVEFDERESIVITIGYFYAEDDKAVYLCSSYFPHQSKDETAPIDTPQRIPKKMIQKIKPIN